MTAPTQPPGGGDSHATGTALMPRDTARWRNGLGVIALALAVLALLAPLSRIEVQGRVGLLLVLAAVLEVAHGFRRSTAAGQRAAWVGGGITLAMGVLLINAPYFATTALVLFLAGWFGLDGVRRLLGAFRRKDTRRSAWSGSLRGSATSWCVAALLVLRGQAVVTWTVAVAGALRIFGTALNIFLSPVFTAGDSGDTVVGELGPARRPRGAGPGPSARRGGVGPGRRSTAAGSSASSPRCSPSTSAAWASTGPSSASCRRASPCSATCSSPCSWRSSSSSRARAVAAADARAGAAGLALVPERARGGARVGATGRPVRC